MPARCCIAGCNSSTNRKDGYAFSLPKNGYLRSQWLKVIPIDLKRIKLLKNPVVCIKHFEKQYLILEEEILYKGKLKRRPCKKPKYKEGAVPTIFPNLLQQSGTPKETMRQDNTDLVVRRNVKGLNNDMELKIISNLGEILINDKFRKIPGEGSVPAAPLNAQKDSNTTTETIRHSDDVKQHSSNLTVKESIQELDKEKQLNKISNFDDIISYMKKRENTLKAWVVLLKEQSSLALCLINLEVECPVFSGCVIIAENLELTVYLDGVKVDINILPVTEKYLSSELVLEDILKFIENKETPPVTNNAVSPCMIYLQT